MAFSQVRRGSAVVFPSPAHLGGNLFVCLRRFFRRATEPCATAIVLLSASGERCPLDSRRRNVATRLPNRGEPMSAFSQIAVAFDVRQFFPLQDKLQFGVLSADKVCLRAGTRASLTLTPQCPSLADRAASRLATYSASELKVVQLCRFYALRSARRCFQRASSS